MTGIKELICHMIPTLGSSWLARRTLVVGLSFKVSSYGSYFYVFLFSFTIEIGIQSFTFLVGLWYVKFTDPIWFRCNNADSVH